MSTKLIIEIIITGIALIGVTAYIQRKKTNKRFLEYIQEYKIQEDITKLLFEKLVDIDPSNYLCFEDFLDYVTGLTLSTTEEVLFDKLNKAVGDGEFPLFVQKLITIELIQKIAEEIALNQSIRSKAQALFVSANKKDIENPENPYDRFTDEDGNKVDVLDPNSFFTDEEDPELEEAEEVKPTEEELSKLNPPSDEGQEEVMDRDVNGLTPEEIEAGVYIDKNGRKRGKNGRYVK